MEGFFWEMHARVHICDESLKSEMKFVTITFGEASTHPYKAQALTLWRSLCLIVIRQS